MTYVDFMQGWNARGGYDTALHCFENLGIGIEGDISFALNKLADYDVSHRRKVIDVLKESLIKNQDTADHLYKMGLNSLTSLAEDDQERYISELDKGKLDFLQILQDLEKRLQQESSS